MAESVGDPLRVWDVAFAGSLRKMGVWPDGLRVLDAESAALLAWAMIRRVYRVSALDVVIETANRDIDLAFTTERETEEFVEAAMTMVRALRPAATGPKVPVVTLGTVPGHDITGLVGLVTASAVITRVADLGTDLKSPFGGRIRGIEAAIDAAFQAALESLVEAADQQGADAIVGLTVCISSPTDKAEGLLMTGTAVTTQPILTHR